MEFECEDCQFVDGNGICRNRKSKNFREDRLFQKGCFEFEASNRFDENVDADFIDEW